MNAHNERFKHSKKGLYHPINPSKYKGNLPIIYRSLLELKMMRWLDKCQNCISWGSESVIVPYLFTVDNQMHNYIIDFNANFRTRTGEVKTYFIEIKCDRELQKPIASTKKKKENFLRECLQYQKNLCKWETAKKWAKSKGAEFLVLSETDLFKSF